ncbi:DNA-directed DNA polymerase [Tanacetum coccineum]
MTTLTEFMILSGVDNRPTIVEKDLMQHQGKQQNVNYTMQEIRIAWTNDILISRSFPMDLTAGKNLQLLCPGLYISRTEGIIAAQQSTQASSYMSNLSSYGSDVLSEVQHSENTHNESDNQSLRKKYRLNLKNDMPPRDNLCVLWRGVNRGYRRKATSAVIKDAAYREAEQYAGALVLKRCAKIELQRYEDDWGPQPAGISRVKRLCEAEEITRAKQLSQRLRKEKEEAQQKKILENLKQLHINLPFIEALAQMPKYAKFLNGLLTNRARLEEACTITMNERCSAVLLNKLPLKEKDPEREPKATRMSLELADRSIQYPIGIVENVLIRVDKFVLPIDFVILDIPEDSRVPIILGIPFLAAARAMIDVFNKKIMLRVGDDEVIFDMDQSIKRSSAEDDECYGVNDLDDAINVEAQELLANDTTDSFLLKGLEKSIEQSDLESCECEAADDSDSIRHIEAVNTPYPVA